MLYLDGKEIERVKSVDILGKHFNDLGKADVYVCMFISVHIVQCKQ